MFSWPSLLRSPVTALAGVLLVLVSFWAGSTLQPLTRYDQTFYLGIAYDLRHTGRFTDGYDFAIPDASGNRPSGMRFVPLYPALLAAAAALEPGFRAAMDCTVENHDAGTSCPTTAKLVRGTQFAMLAAVYVMVWWIAGALTGSLRGAWIGVVLALGTAPYLLRSVNYLMTEMTALFLTTLLATAGVAAIRSRHPWRWAGVAGVTLGLLALTRPAFLYLFVAAAVTGGVAAVFAGQFRRRAAAFLLVALVAGFALPVGPWILRNAVVLERPALSFGYASHTLVQRISYDAMTWREYGLFYVCGLPDGTGLGELLDGPGACDRFGLDERPTTFYAIGIGPMLEQTLAAAGGYEHHLSYLLDHYILREPLKHALVSIPMALRGAWVQHYWGLVLGPVCLVLTIGALRRRHAGFLVLALPAWFMLVFNAVVAVNQVRYNLMLVPPYAVAGAMVIERRLSRSRFGAGSGFTAAGPGNHPPASRCQRVQTCWPPLMCNSLPVT